MTGATLRRAAGTLLLVLGGCAAVAFADPTDDFIRAEMKRQNIPGLALAVVKDGVVIKAAGYGVADRKSQLPVTPDTLFRIASVSKQFMAAGAMLLVQEGRLSLTDSVERFIPDVPAAWRAITIRHLLSHTGGLRREGPSWSPASMNDLEVIRSAYDLPLNSTPGTKWEYSNLGYTVLAEILARVSGRPWRAFIAERIFGPAGLTTTRTTTVAPLPVRATGYSDNDRLLEAPDWPAVRPGGGFMSTVLDLAKWDATLYGNAILSEASRREMWTATPLADGTLTRYGLGWFVSRGGARLQVWHDGGLPGFKAQMRRYYDDRLTVIVLMNLDDADDESIALGIAERYLPPK